MARMVAQRNSRAFQTSLMGRQQALDKHILALLTNMADPTFLKKKHGYNVHGQMVGKDGKMISKVCTTISRGHGPFSGAQWRNHLHISVGLVDLLLPIISSFLE